MRACRLLSPIAPVAVAAALVSCKGSSPGAAAAGRPAAAATTPASSVRAQSAASNDLSRRFSQSSSLLSESLTKPTAPFHFSYKAEENINPKYPRDKTAKPEVGPYQLEGDFSPDVKNFTTVRGRVTNVVKAPKSDEMAWNMSNLDLIGPVTSIGLLLAFGQAVAQPAGTETVGGVAADKYLFDTSTATGTTKMGLDIARSMITNIGSTRGTVWLDKSTGMLVKFNIDADFADKNHNAWKEHYEGEVTPK